MAQFTFGIPKLTGPVRVKAGDLITADFINAILDRLDAIEARLSELEGGIQPTKPTFTLPTFTLPTATFHPTFTFPTFATFPTMTFQPTFQPTFTTFQPTLLTPTFPATLNPSTFIATFLNPTFGMPMQPGSIVTMSEGGAIFHPDTPTTSLPGVNPEHEAALNKAGIRTVNDFSKADSKTIADALKTNEKDAKVMIGIANNVLGRGPGK